ncbi:MAG: SDR family oxidoreductase [Anaerolineae bacterium]
MKDKMVLVTGANAGIGKVTAQDLAKMGAQVVMVARSRERGEAALADVRRASGSDRVDLLLADLSVQAEVRRLASEFREKYGRLDVLVNNAGALFTKRLESADGIEMTFALNHLGYFLLTNLLLDLLKASAPSRIVNVSSTAHTRAELNFDDLENKTSFSGMNVYGQSKLANVYFTYELARRLAGTGVTANCLHPGFVASNFAKNNGLLAKAGMLLMRPFAISPEKGAETSIYLASSPEVEGVTGKYFDKKQPVQSAAVSYDETAARRLWQISEQMTGLA